jgi:hypothetical protein
MQVHLITDSESSSSPILFRTTQAHDSKAGQIGSKARASKGHQVFLGDQVADLESLSSPILRTPSVTDGTGGAISETQARQRGRMVKVADQVAELAFDNNLKVSPSIADSLLPTPTVGHVRNHDEPVEDYLQRRQDYVDGKTKGMPGASLGVAVRMEILNDDVVSDSNEQGL